LIGNEPGGIGGFAFTPGRVPNGGIPLSKLADIPTATILGRNTAGAGVAEAVTMAQLSTQLGLATQYSGWALSVNEQFYNLKIGALNNVLPTTSGTASSSSGSSNIVFGGSEAFPNSVLGFSLNGILGGYNNSIDASSPGANGILWGMHCSIVNTNHGVIGGGSTQTLNNANYSWISGGFSNSIASSNYASIAGGSSNSLTSSPNAVIGGGASNVVSSAQNAVIAGGSANNVSATGSIVIGGAQNLVSANFGIAGGQQNQVSAPYSIALGLLNLNAGDYAVALGRANEIDSNGDYGSAMGWQAKSYRRGYHVVASGAFTATGDAQAGTAVLRRQTTDATTLTLGLDGGSTHWTSQNDSASALTIQVAARNTASDVQNAGWTFALICRKSAAGTLAIVGTVQTLVASSDAGASTWTCVVTASGNNLLISVTGEAGKTINWAATVRWTEVVG